MAARFASTRRKPADVPRQESVDRLLTEERERALPTTAGSTRSASVCANSKLDLLALLRDLQAGWRRIYGVGAPSRASTLVNFAGLDDGILDCVLEISTSKKSASTSLALLIPVVDEGRLFEDQPEYALLLSWHIADELCGNLLRKGFRGDFVVPLPEPHIVTARGSLD